jgi:hypothetical protein
MRWIEGEGRVCGRPGEVLAMVRHFRNFGDSCPRQSAAIDGHTTSTRNTHFWQGRCNEILNKLTEQEEKPIAFEMAVALPVIYSLKSNLNMLNLPLP